MTGPEAFALGKIEFELDQIAEIARAMSAGLSTGDPCEGGLRGIADYLSRISSDIERMTDNVTKD
ncbi:hypothetical protein TomMM35A_18500 [Sphingobium sp. TomMM35A]